MAQQKPLNNRIHNDTKAGNGKNNQDPVKLTSILDLRTDIGQIIFLFIALTIAILVKMLPTQHNEINLNNQNDTSSAKLFSENQLTKKPIYWLYGRSADESHLKHVKLVLKRLGFERGSNITDWDLLWAHDYPYTILSPQLQQSLKPHQKINHFPGCGYLTNKVDLVTSNLKYIPKAFKLPKDKDKFMEYANSNPKKLFVQKHNQHRHINIRSLDEINFSDGESFIQEYVDNPLLVDGHKFDIGVYVIITSVDPLRVYIYNGDVLFRYCPVKYYPFDPKNVDKYIVGDDYLPTWEVPSLTKYYNGLGFGMRESFNAYLRAMDRDPTKVWEQVEDAIRIAILAKEKHIVDILKRYKTKRNFFEMMRFDLVIDNDLKVYLMEANMSPNLSSAHFHQNTLLYEQVIYNIFNLVGVASLVNRESFRKQPSDVEIMLSSMKNIAVEADVCVQQLCNTSCDNEICSLCKSCLNYDFLNVLHTAYREHFARGETKRIVPKPIPISVKSKPIQEIDLEFQSLTKTNKLMSRWFHDKCKMDSNWCS